MCKFFSCVSDGKGKVSFFTPEDVVSIMASGNERSYDFNSHTSLMHFLGIKGKDEDSLNKWQYNPKKKVLTKNHLGAKDNDAPKVKKALEKFFDGKNLEYIQNLYGRNTGHRNTGHRNTGHRNTGHWNTGHRNTGHWNTGHWNTGHWNTGHFCTIQAPPMLFNKPCSKESDKKAQELNDYLFLTEWIWASDMTKAEKEANEFWQMMEGYLKVRSYTEAWAIVAEKHPEVVKEIMTWENFDAAVFKEITGLTVKP